MKSEYQCFFVCTLPAVNRDQGSLNKSSRRTAVYTVANAWTDSAPNTLGVDGDLKRCLKLSLEMMLSRRRRR